MAEDKGTAIWVTKAEKAFLAEAKLLFAGFTKSKMSWGAYLCALSIGGLAMKATIGITMRCPDCGHEVEVKLSNPRNQLQKTSRLGQKTESHSQIPQVSSSALRAPRP